MSEDEETDAFLAAAAADALKVEDISLDQFIKSECQRLERFRKDWLEQMAVHPDLFPESMPPGEWDEQLLAFDS